MGNSKSKGLGKYYYHNIEKIENLSENDKYFVDLEQRVSLNISLNNIEKNKIYYVELIANIDTEKKSHKSLGLTEKKSGEDNIKFDQFFTIPYFFEKQQNLEFIIYKGNKKEIIETTLGNIIGSIKNTFTRKLKNGLEIQVIGKEIKKSNKLIEFNIKIKSNSINKKIAYSITNLGTTSEPENKKLYESETINIKPNKEMKFNPCLIPFILLNPKKQKKEIIF